MSAVVNDVTDVLEAEQVERVECLRVAVELTQRFATSLDTVWTLARWLYGEDV